MAPYGVSLAVMILQPHSSSISATAPISSASRPRAGWRLSGPRDCVGEFRHDDCPLTLGLPRLTIAEAAAAGAKTLVLGIANAGGTMGGDLIDDAAAALEAGMNVAAGLHQRLRDVPRLAALAKAARAASCSTCAIRRPICGRQRLSAAGAPAADGRHRLFGRQDVRHAGSPRALQARGVQRRFPRDRADRHPDRRGGRPDRRGGGGFHLGRGSSSSRPRGSDDGWDVIEGQGSLFHPSFAGVSTGLLHGAQPEALVLCHDPARTYMRGLPGRALPGLAECLAANLQVARLTSPSVRAVGVCLNTSSSIPPARGGLCRKTAGVAGPALHRSAGVRRRCDPLTRLLCLAPSTPSTIASR